MSEFLLPAHLTILGLTAIGILLADHEAFAWMRGKKQLLNRKRLFIFHLWVGFGLIGMITTGVLMFLPMREYLLANSFAFIIKMGFVAILVGNSFVIGKLLTVSSTRTYASLTSAERIPLFVSGALSSISWIGAGICALFLFS